MAHKKKKHHLGDSKAESVFNSKSVEFFKGLESPPPSKSVAASSSASTLGKSLGCSLQSKSLQSGMEDFPPLPLRDVNPHISNRQPVEGPSQLMVCVPEQAASPKDNWSNLFGNTIDDSVQLSYHEPVKINGRIKVQPPPSIANIGCDYWRNALVGQFIDKPPPFSAVRNIVNILWKKYGNIDIKATDDGLYFFRFENAQICNEILLKQWHISQRPLLLRKWHPGIELQNFRFDKVPIWVKLRNIPTEYWTKEGISYVASAIGKPLQLESLLESKTRLSFVKVCVEIGLNEEFPNSFDLIVEGEDGNCKSVEILVEYPWKPTPCVHCKVFGHPSSRCPLAKKDPQPPVPKRNVEGKSNANLEWRTKGGKNKALLVSSQQVTTPTSNNFNVLDSLNNDNQLSILDISNQEKCPRSVPATDQEPLQASLSAKSSTNSESTPTETSQTPNASLERKEGHLSQQFGIIPPILHPPSPPNK